MKYMLTLIDKVHKGADLLDKAWPQWERVVDLSRLDMACGSFKSGCGCVGAQIDGQLTWRESTGEWVIGSAAHCFRSQYGDYGAFLNKLKYWADRSGIDASGIGFSNSCGFSCSKDSMFDYPGALWSLEIVYRLGNSEMMKQAEMPLPSVSVAYSKLAESTLPDFLKPYYVLRFELKRTLDFKQFWILFPLGLEFPLSSISQEQATEWNKMSESYRFHLFGPPRSV